MRKIDRKRETERYRDRDRDREKDKDKDKDINFLVGTTSYMVWNLKNVALMREAVSLNGFVHMYARLSVCVYVSHQ